MHLYQYADSISSIDRLYQHCMNLFGKSLNVTDIHLCVKVPHCGFNYGFPTLPISRVTETQMQKTFETLNVGANQNSKTLKVFPDSCDSSPPFLVIVLKVCCFPRLCIPSTDGSCGAHCSSLSSC